MEEVEELEELEEVDPLTITVIFLIEQEEEVNGLNFRMKAKKTGSTIECENQMEIEAVKWHRWQPFRAT